MTLQERRGILDKRLDEIRGVSEKYRSMADEAARQVQQLMGAISVLDQLIAEEVNESPNARPEVMGNGADSPAN